MSYFLPIQLQHPHAPPRNFLEPSAVGRYVHLGVGESFNCFLQLELLVSVAGLQLRSCIS